jgi:hypothetical protein
MGAEREVIGEGPKALGDEEKKNYEGMIGSDHKVISDDDLENLSIEQLAHRFVEIADRGITNLRLNVPLPDHIHGEWVPNDSASIAEYRLKGFKIDDEHAVKYGLHSDGSGRPLIGDVVFMTCPKRIKQALDMASEIRYKRTHGQTRNLPEESQFEDSVHKMGLGTKWKDRDTNTSVQERVSQSQILATVKGR